MRFAYWGLVGLLGRAEESSAPVVPPPVCSCATEVANCETRFNAQIKAADQLAARKAADALDAVKKSHAVELQKWSAAVDDLNKKYAAAQASVKSLESKGSNEVQALQRSLSSLEVERKSQLEKETAVREEHAAQLAAARAARERAERDAAAAEARLSGELAAAKAALEAAEGQLERGTGELRDMERRLSSYEGVVFGQEHFELMTKNLWTIGSALAYNAKQNVNRVFNADVFELGRLQSLLVYSKVRPYSDSVWARVAELSEQHGWLDRLETAKASSAPYLAKGREFFEQRMERIIDSLSVSNPGIRAMFPPDFTGRLIAFGYLFTVFYIVSGIFNAIFSFFFAPLKYLLASPKKTKPPTAAPSAAAHYPSKAKKLETETRESVSTIKHRKI